MSQHVYWTIEATVHEGKLSQLRDAMSQLVVQTREREPGALAYEWWLDDEQSQLHIYERYADSDAAMNHLTNVSDLLPQLLSAVAMTRLTIYGPASEELRGAFAGSNPHFMTALGGFAR